MKFRQQLLDRYFVRFSKSIILGGGGLRIHNNATLQKGDDTAHRGNTNPKNKNAVHVPHDALGPPRIQLGASKRAGCAAEVASGALSVSS